MSAVRLSGRDKHFAQLGFRLGYTNESIALDIRAMTVESYTNDVPGITAAVAALRGGVS